MEAFLRGRGIEVYFPTIPAPTSSRTSGERAFFPSYLFAHVDLPAVGLWTLHYAPGVRGVVMFGGIPARVDDGIIARLKERLANVDVVDTLGDALNSGDRVVITQGPFADFEAVFDKRLSADGRVRVLLEFLRRTTPVEVDARVLRKISRSSKVPSR